MSVQAARASCAAPYARTEENLQGARSLNGRPVGLGLTNINQKWMNMLVHIATKEKREIDYILQLVEVSTDAELMRRAAIVCGEGVLYIAEIEVKPEL